MPPQSMLRTRADALAERVHAHQVRAGGVPYIQHPRAVCRSVEADGMPSDPEVSAAALLHDAVEDQAAAVVAALCPKDGLPPGSPGASRRDGDLQAAALQAISEVFGPRVSALVARVTHGGGAPGKAHTYADRVLTLFGESDPGALRIKLADLAENALALDALPPGDRRDRLERKYRPVVRGVVARLEALSPEHPWHPLRLHWLERFRAEFPPAP